MKRPYSFPRPAALGAASALLLAALAAPLARGQDSLNHLDLSGGSVSVSGDTANFQHRYDLSKSGYGGIDSFYYQTDLDKKTTLTADGHALFGNYDYLFDLRLEREGTGSLDVGYKMFRTWYDNNGGFFPPSDLFLPAPVSDLHIDRTNWWVQALINPNEFFTIKLRYDLQLRKGLTDSTSWGDTTLTNGLGTRAVVPTFLRIDERRHILSASVDENLNKTSWNLTGRYETDTMNNDIEVHRSPGQSSDRYVTQANGTDSTLWMVHGSVEHHVTDQMLMTAGVAHYNIDTTLSGSRIYGSTYDPVFDPAYARRQNHDEGFYGLEGGATMNETLANLSMMYTPSKNWTIVPALRGERTSWNADSQYVETAVGSNSVMAIDDQDGASNKDYKELTGSLETRYTGVKNWAFNAIGEATSSYGTLTEDLVAVETGVDGPYRTTDYRRGVQRIGVTGDWYAKRGLSFTVQYYWKGRQDSFRNSRISVNQDPSSGDRYPGYIAHQDFETNDFNARMSWQAMPNLRLVTRYDYQKSTIRTQTVGLAFGQSGDLNTNIVSETATWNPLPRWYLQGSVSWVHDQTTTPAVDLTGNAAGIVLNSDNDFVNGALSTGYAIDDQSNIAVEYSYYRADNFVDNSTRSQPYGAGDTEHFVSVTWSRRLTLRTTVALKYAYADCHDDTFGGNTNFHANLVYGKMSFRF